MERLDLIALTSQVGTSCYREINGKKVYDFKRVVITVNNPDGSKKKYIIVREACRSDRFMHHIETYTIPAETFWYDEKRNKRWTWYNTDEHFASKLNKLSREIAKTNHEIRVFD